LSCSQLTKEKKMGYRSDDLKRPAYVPRKKQDYLVLGGNSQPKKVASKND
jgi:hypothetical protein